MEAQLIITKYYKPTNFSIKILGDSESNKSNCYRRKKVKLIQKKKA